MKTVLTGLRLDASRHKEFKEVCKANDISISKALKTMTVVFLSNDEFQQKIVSEAKRK